MAKKIIKAQMKQRQDTKANWAAANPVLLDGELGMVSDDRNLYKVGDGRTAWNDLPFRGFDGTLAQELGTSPNAAISQKAVTEKLTELSAEIAHHFEKETSETYDYLHDEIDFALKKGAKIVNRGIELIIASDISLADSVTILKGTEYVLNSDKEFLCSVPTGKIDFDYVPPALTNIIEDVDVKSEIEDVKSEIEDVKSKIEDVKSDIEDGFLIASSVSGWKSSPILYIDFIFKNDAEYGSGVMLKDESGNQVLYKTFPVEGEKRVGIEKIVEHKDGAIISLVVNWDYYADGFNKVLDEPIYLPKLSFLSDTSQSLANMQKIAELYQNVPTHHFAKETSETYDYLHDEIDFALKKGAKIVNRGIELMIASDISLADKVSILKGEEYVLDSDKEFLCSVPTGKIDFDYVLYASPGDVEDVKKSINLAGADSVEVVLPKTIYAVVGDTLQVFYRGLIQAVNPYNYDILISCEKGRQFPRYWEYQPTSADIGETTFTIHVRDNSMMSLKSASCKIVTIAKGVSPSSSINVACFGDSLTDGGDWCAEAARRLTGEGGQPSGDNLNNIAFVGKKKKNGYGYYGEGGWTWKSYTTKDSEPAYRFFVNNVSSLSLNATYSLGGITYTIKEINVTAGSGNILCIPYGNTTPPSSGTMTKITGNGDATIEYASVQRVGINPLWDDSNNRMSFIPYANAYCNGKIDIVYTLLTWNGLTDNQKDFSAIISDVKIFADTLHREFPSAKMKIMGLQIPSVTGGMGANYGANGGYADHYGMAITAFNLNKAYQDFAMQDSYKGFVEYVDIASQFDTEYNMPYAMEKVNVRSSQTEMRGTNGVHPSIDGYMQIADVVYRSICAEL